MKKILTIMMLALIPTMLAAKTFDHGTRKEVILAEENLVVIKGMINGASISKAITRIQKLDSELPSGQPIILVMNTGGGYISYGLNFIEAIKGINRPIHTLTMFAASMGWQIVQHADKRMILDYGELMSHKARGGFSGEFGDLASQLDSRYSLWIRKILFMDMVTVKRTNKKQTLKSYRAAYENELWVMGEEAVKLGYADEVVVAKCSKTLAGTNDENVNFMGMEILVQWDKCPINTYPVNVQINIYTNKNEFMPYNIFTAKGGKLGPDCVREDGTAEQTNRWGGTEQKPVKAELCAYDPALTVKKLIDAKAKFKMTLTSPSASKKVHRMFAK